MILLSNSPGGAIPQEKTAVVKDGLDLSYGGLKKRISSFSNYLITKGLRPNDTAALYLRDPLDLIVSAFALWNMNSAAAPVNLRLSLSEIETQLKFAGIKYVITDSEVPLPGFEIINSGGAAGYSGDGFFQVNMESDIPSLYIFTSGSTGTPKAVVHSLRTLYNSFIQSSARFNFSADAAWAASLPVYHIGGFQIFLRAFLAGSSVIIPEEIKNEFILDALYQHSPAYISLVPTQLKQFVDDGIKPPESLKTLFLGGGFSSGDLVQRAAANGWPVVQVYGSTETGSMVTASEPNDVRKGAAGKPLPGVDIKIADKGRELPAGKTGEICISCGSMFAGYLGMREFYEGKFIGGYYMSGDFGRLDDEGSLYIEARREDLIISGGENISPFEIEEILLNYTGVKEAVVFQMEDSKWGHIPAAAIVIDRKINADVLDTFLRERIAAYKMPRRIFYLESIPKTPLGKVNRAKVRELCELL